VTKTDHIPDACQKRVLEQFRSFFGGPATHVAAAPGRVNLIGEHTDYNDGFVLPMAIERKTVIAARRRDDQRVRIMSTGVEGVAEFDIESDITPGEPAWANYVKGAIAGCMEFGLSPGGFDALIHSTVPVGGGLSSSASIEVATATLIEALTGKSIDPVQKALLCQKAEHDFAGMPCGIMDQFISTMGREGSALLIDCRSHKTKLVPMDGPDIEVLIINSNIEHELVDGEYAKRRAQCESAAQTMKIASLRDATMERLESVKTQLDDVIYRRARHVIRDNERTLITAQALESHDWKKVGANMFESHASLRDDFEVSTPELDLLVDLAAQRHPTGGVIGSRMTGGGFGGCTVTLVHADQAQDVIEFICKSYRKQTGTDAIAFTTRPAEGACILMP
jgi:galactokinase